MQLWNERVTRATTTKAAKKKGTAYEGSFAALFPGLAFGVIDGSSVTPTFEPAPGLRAWLMELYLNMRAFLDCVDWIKRNQGRGLDERSLPV